MADFIKLWNTARGRLQGDHHALLQDAERNRERERRAALTIQSCWRMYRVVKDLKRQHAAAMFLQAMVRAVLAKMKRRRQLITELRESRQMAFHTGAVKFQALYKGFWSRKYIHDYYKMQAYMAKLEHGAAITQTVLQNYRRKEVRRIEDERLKRKQLRHMERVNREHHLIGTKLIPGVYTNGAGPVQEDELRTSVKDLHLTRKPALHLTRFGGHDLSQWKGHTLGQSKPLPPVQGPFKSPQEVADIKNRQDFVSLRAQTDYYTDRHALVKDREQDWVRRVNNSDFVPWSNKARTFNGYIPDLVNTSKFTDFLDSRVCQSMGARAMDTSCREPVRDMTKTMAGNKFDATVRSIRTFDGVNA